MPTLLALVLALSTVSCQTGQTVRDLITPDELHLSGEVGDADFEGELGRCRPVGFDGDVDSHAFGATLVFNLTARDERATRANTRAINALADTLARLEGVQVAAAGDVELTKPGRCSGRTIPQEQETAAELDECDADEGEETTQLALVPGDDEGVALGDPEDLAGLAVLILGAIVAYLKREAIGRGAHRLRQRGRKRAAAASAKLKEEPPSGL